MSPPPVPALSADLLERLKERVQSTLVRLIKNNRRTRFVSESPVFSDFRRALDAVGDTDAVLQDEWLLECFRTTIPFTSYDACEPFVRRLVTPNAREKDVKDMFSPGLPYFLASSSGTSGNKAKLFPKYRRAPGSSLQDVDDHANPVCGGKNCIVYSLAYQDIIQVMGDDGTAVGRFPITCMSSGVIRMQNGMDVDKDPWIITLTAPRSTSPVAISFIVNYRSFLLMHVLFALAEPEVGTINTLFGPVFVDMVRYMEEEWDTLIHSIETGALPEWEGTDHVRQYLEPKFPAKPERAAYLGAIGRATEQPGWLKKLWPGLRVVIGIASGVFSFIIPKIRHYIGPDVRMSSLGFTASEAYVGTAFSSTDLNLFKATSDDIIEYLDVSKAGTVSSLVFAHEVEVGRRYEVVVTTYDGLWRYPLGDVVEVAGFDSIDGSPILRFIERRGAFIRVPGVMINEEQLVSAIFSAQEVLGRITEFTVVVDDREVPSSIAFLVEIDGTVSTSADQAPARIEADLCRSNENVQEILDIRQLASPTVHVLKRGTFREYRALKVEVIAAGAGQVKLPVVLRDDTAQEWMLTRVERVIARRPSAV